MAFDKTKILGTFALAVAMLLAVSYLGITGPLVLALLSVITAALVYFLASIKSPFEVSPAFFLTIMISMEYGLPAAFIFLLLASILPALVAGGEIGIASFLFMASFLALGYAATVLQLPITQLGIVLSIANLVAGYIISVATGNRAGIFFSLFNAAVSIFYFWAFGGVIAGLLA